MSTWTSIRDSTIATLGAVAPTIATALGGPMAGQAVSALENALGLPKTGDHNAVDAALANATPDQLLAIKNAEYTFKTQMKQLEVDVQKLNEADRKSARQMKMQTGDKTPDYLTVLIIVGFIAMAYVVLSGSANTTLKDPVIAAVAGGIITEVLHAIRYVLRFWFGGDSADAKETT